MKKFKRLISLVLGACMIFGASNLIGCKKKTGYDENRSQLFIKYYNGGVGRVWIDELIKGFEQEYASVSFEKGKQGVQVVMDPEKSVPTVSTIKGNYNQVYITVNVNYSEFVAGGAMMDITDVVTGNALTTKDTPETVTIESKMSTDRKNTYNLGTDAKPSYYALPFFESSVNLNYNVSVFEAKKLYFAEGKTAEGWSDADLKDKTKVQELFIASLTEPRSAGPDGNPATAYDNGLPATYDDFQALITMMEGSGVIPFIWNGTATSYLTCLANEMWANNEGKENYMATFNFRGNAENLVQLTGSAGKEAITLNSDGSAVLLDDGDGTALTPETSYLIHAQKGKYDALRLVEMIAKSDYYDNSFSENYLSAQDIFIHAETKKETENKPIGMLVEGTWWNNEAKASYASEQDRYNYNFGILPLPKVDASQIGTPNTKISERESLMFISNYCDAYAIPIAKAFMKYINSDKAMNIFTQKTDMLRALNYDLTKDTLNTITNYGKSVYQISREVGTEWVDWMPQSIEAQKNKGLLDYLSWSYRTTLGSNPFELIVNNKLTAEQLFNSSYNFIKGSWAVKSEK